MGDGKKRKRDSGLPPVVDAPAAALRSTAEPAEPLAGPCGALDKGFDDRFHLGSAGSSDDDGAAPGDAEDDAFLPEDLDELDAAADDAPAVPDQLSTEALLEYKAKADRTGIIYLSRIPPGMGPSQVRHLLSRYGELGRVFLKHDDRGAPPSKRRKQKHRSHHFVEGWVEFADKRVARNVADLLNGSPIGGKKSSRFRDDIWMIKYLPRYKWYMLSEHVALESSIQTNLLRSHISQSKRDQADYLEQVERARVNAKRDAKQRAAAADADHDETERAQPPKAKKQRAFAQRTVVEPKQAASASSSKALEGVLNSLF